MSDVWKPVRAAATYLDDRLTSVGAAMLRSPRRDVRDDDTLTLEQFDSLLASQPRRQTVWRPFAQQLCSRPATRTARATQFAWQRLTRGWDDRSVWSLDVHLARTLSEQLNHLANTTHTWPGPPAYPTPEAWEQALRENAELLRNYTDSIFTETDSERIDERYRDAQQALRWVAANFGHLWD